MELISKPKIMPPMVPKAARTIDEAVSVAVFDDIGFIKVDEQQFEGRCLL